MLCNTKQLKGSYLVPPKNNNNNNNKKQQTTTNKQKQKNKNNNKIHTFKHSDNFSYFCILVQ